MVILEFASCKHANSGCCNFRPNGLVKLIRVNDNIKSLYLVQINHVSQKCMTSNRFINCC